MESSSALIQETKDPVAYNHPPAPAQGFLERERDGTLCAFDFGWFDFHRQESLLGDTLCQVYWYIYPCVHAHGHTVRDVPMFSMFTFSMRSCCCGPAYWGNLEAPEESQLNQFHLGSLCIGPDLAVKSRVMERVMGQRGKTSNTRGCVW